MFGILKLPDVSDDSFNLVVEKLFIALIEFDDSDAFLLTDVELLLQRLVFCKWNGGVKRLNVIRIQMLQVNHLWFHFVLAKFPLAQA